MFFRVRRWIAVVLSLTLLPTASEGAQCASHEAGSVAVGEESAPVSAQADAASDHQHAGHESHDRDVVTEQIVQDCCPPTTEPGACSSGMGCGVVSVAETETGRVAGFAGSTVAAAPGSVLSPGPSRAPDVPPPRA